MPPHRDQADLELSIRGLAEAGDLRGAATKAIQGYGPNLLGYLIAITGDEQAGREAFAQLSEDLWSGLQGFRWDCPLRTWAFTLAYHAASRLARDPWRKRTRRLATSEASQLAADVKSSSASHLREVSARLREGLDAASQTLLILRVHHELPWAEVAGVLDIDEAAARKRFERIKRELARNAEAMGLGGGARNERKA